jgi:hypothetical protein
MAASLFDALAERIVTPGSVHEYRFEDIGRAQRDMEDRKTAGAVIPHVGLLARTCASTHDSAH